MRVTILGLGVQIPEIPARLLIFGMQIPELLTQRKFVSVDCHAHSTLRFGVQIPELLTHLFQFPELLTQRKFVSVMCHAHSNAHKPPKTLAPD